MPDALLSPDPAIEADQADPPREYESLAILVALDLAPVESLVVGAATRRSNQSTRGRSARRQAREARREATEGGPTKGLSPQ